MDTFKDPNTPLTARALIVSATPELALFLGSEVVRYGWESRYQRIETQDEMQQALLAQSWDVLVGAWDDVSAAGAAWAKVPSSAALRSLSLLRLSDTTLFTAVASGSQHVEQEALRLAAAIEQTFRGLRPTSRAGNQEDPEFRTSSAIGPPPDFRHIEIVRLAHDLNNLLTVLLGCADVLSVMLAGNLEAAHYVDEMIAAVRRGESLAADLLGVAAAPAANRIDCESTIVGIRSLLQRVAGPDLKLRVACASGSHIVPITGRQLEAVCTELVYAIVTNTAPSGGTIEITVDSLPAEAHPEFLLPPGEGTRLHFAIATEGTSTAEPTPLQFVESRQQAEEVGLARVFRVVASVGGRILLRKSAVGPEFTILFPGVASRMSVPGAKRGQAAAHVGGPAIYAAIRVLSASIRRQPWNAGDEVILRRRKGDIRSTIQAIALDVIREDLLADRGE